MRDIEDYGAKVEMEAPYGLSPGLRYEGYVKAPMCQLY